MSKFAVPVVLAAAASVFALSVLPASARITPEPGEALTGEQGQSRAEPPKSLCVQGTLATNARDNEPGDAYAGYPGGAAGTSNGELSAAQKGEPLGAGGTSGGWSGPFARSSDTASAVPTTGGSGPVSGCSPHTLLAHWRWVR